VTLIFTSRRFGSRFSMEAKSPPVCSSCHAPARRVGTSIFDTQLIGERSSISDGW
jgi:hypothetical protein